MKTGTALDGALTVPVHSTHPRRRGIETLQGLSAFPAAAGAERPPSEPARRRSPSAACTPARVCPECADVLLRFHLLRTWSVRGPLFLPVTFRLFSFRKKENASLRLNG